MKRSSLEEATLYITKWGGGQHVPKYITVSGNKTRLKYKKHYIIAYHILDIFLM